MNTQAIEVQNDNIDQTAAAREAADQALNQAKEAATTAVASLKTLDGRRMTYLGALATFLVLTLIFDMASFEVGVDYAVSETVAQAQRDLQARMNSWSYSLFSSAVSGKIAWFSAAAGVGLVIWSVTQKSRAAWIPLAEIACGVICALAVLLLFFVGFPDLSAYEDARCSATVFGYWMPLVAAGTAAMVSVHRLLK